VAAVRTGRHYLGFDTDSGYVAAARVRVAAEAGETRVRTVRPARPTVAPAGEDYLARGRREGRRLREVARWALEAGASDGSAFEVVAEGARMAAGLTVDFVARDATGGEWAVDVVGAFTVAPAGLRRSDQLLRAVGKAAVLGQLVDRPYLVLTVDAPPTTSAAGRALAAVTGPGRPFTEVIDLDRTEHRARLRRLGAGHRPGPTGDPPSRLPGST
jgi:hypothetical protein